MKQHPLEQVYYKTCIQVIAQFILQQNKSIKQITLVEFQQRVWSNIDNLSGASKREQDRALDKVKPKMYNGNLTESQASWQDRWRLQ